MNRKTTLMLCSIAGAVLALTPALAQDVPATTGRVSEPEPGEIIVTARKIAENLQTVPVSITAFSGLALERQSVKSVIDLQFQTPGLFFQPAVGDAQSLTLSIRGQKQNDIPPTVDASVGLYIDNVYYPRTLGLAGALLDLDRAEVLRGPQGTLFGRNTTGGALNLFTKNPTGELGGSLSATYGNYDAWNVSGILNIPISSDLSARLVGQRGKHDGYGHDALDRDLNDEDSLYLRGKLRLDSGPVKAVLSGIYQQNKTGGAIAKLAGLSPADPTTGTPAGGTATFETLAELGLVGTPENLAQVTSLLQSYADGSLYRTGATGSSYSHFKGGTASLDVTADLGGNITLRSISAYEKLRRRLGQDIDGTPFTIIDTNTSTRDRYYSQELQLLGGSKTFNWVVGAYYGDESAHQFESAVALALLNPTNPSISDADIRNKSLAAFAQANWTFLPNWRLTLGARESGDRRVMISRNRNGVGCNVPAPGVEVTNVPGAADSGPGQCPRTFAKTFKKPSWLVSIDHQWTRDLFVYGKASYGYRTGGWPLRAANTAQSFASFAPETVTEFEAGVKADLFDRLLRLNLAAYHDEYKNIQRNIGAATPNGIPIGIITNAASSRINGFEAEATVRPAAGLTFAGSAGYIDAQYKKFVDVTGDRSDETFGIPKWTLTGSASYVAPTAFGDANAQLDYHWQSKVYLDPSTATLNQGLQRGYGLLNARVGVSLDRLDFDVALFAKNITNKSYKAALQSLESALSFNEVFPGDPRTYGITLTKRFGRF